jgi:tetratricopeptide (TPR) repeat protein
MRRVTFHLVLILLLTSVVAQAQTAPKTAEEYLDRGFGSFILGDLDGAIADFTKAVEINPRYTEAYVWRGLARDYKGDHDGALADFNKAIEINPRLGAPYYGRGIVREGVKDHEGAIADFTRAIKLIKSVTTSPKPTREEIRTELAEEYSSRCGARRQINDLDGANADCNKAIKLDPGNAKAYGFRGLVRLQRGRDDEAGQDFKKCFELDSSFKTEIEQQANQIRQQRKPQ